MSKNKIVFNFHYKTFNFAIIIAYDRAQKYIKVCSSLNKLYRITLKYKKIIIEKNFYILIEKHFFYFPLNIAKIVDFYPFQPIEPFDLPKFFLLALAWVLKIWISDNETQTIKCIYSNNFWMFFELITRASQKSTLKIDL